MLVPRKRRRFRLRSAHPGDTDPSGLTIARTKGDPAIWVYAASRGPNSGSWISRSSVWVLIGEGRDPGRGQDLAVGTGRSLEDPLLVDQEHVSAGLGKEASNQAVDILRVDGSSQDEAFVSPDFPIRCYDEVRRIPVPEKDFADVDPAAKDFTKPGCFPIVPSLQFVGAGVGKLRPVGFDHAKVGEASEGGLHVFQGFGQGTWGR